MSKKLLQAAAGAAGEATYVDDVFSTYLYTGNSSTQTITNGIDLDGEGGLVWLKARGNVGQSHWLYDDQRSSFSAGIRSDTTNAEYDPGNSITSVSSDGFSIGAYSEINTSTVDYASWTFRKAPGFFDVVTYTGDGVAGRTVSHNLGCVPGCIIVKRTDTTSDWNVYHKGLNVNSDNAPETDLIYLNSTSAAFDYPAWNDTAPTASQFTVWSHVDVNASGGTYVAYLFADGDDADAQIFGTDGDQAVVKCGSYTGTGATGNEIDLGFEPQFIMFKRTDSTSDWVMFDSMRGLGVSGSGNSDSYLYPNLSNAEGTLAQIAPTATGFVTEGSWGEVNGSGGNYIYIAIRRPMKTPESGTEVFAVDQGDASTTNPQFVSNFPVDMAIMRNVSSTNSNFLSDRLRGTKYLITNATDAEANDTNITYDYPDGFFTSTTSTNHYSWMFKRAPGFFDVVCYTGDGSGGGTASYAKDHNLGVVPEMMIVKNRDYADHWVVYHKDLDVIGYGSSQSALILNTSGAAFSTTNSFNTDPTNTTFYVGSANAVNRTGDSHIAYLFASQDGISKVGSYTGNGSSQTIDCGFSSGARFVLIKRTDSTSDWNLFDTERGIVAGNDYRLELNTTSNEDTGDDCIDPDSSGFTVNYIATNDDDVNVSSATYIYLAIA